MSITLEPTGIVNSEGGVSYVHLDLDLTISLDHGKVRHGAAFVSSGTHTSHDHTRGRPSLSFPFHPKCIMWSPFGNEKHDLLYSQPTYIGV